jgi:basic amino acid/polyamine antiporter, APA family
MQTRRLPVDLAMYRMSDARHRLPRVFGTGQLVILGLGVMIGAGIFSLSGTQAATNAGPAVIASFVLAALVCFVAALSYAELSSTIPVAGSVYTFSYVAFGELWAWLVGWALILELLVAAALVSRAWSAYSLATLDGLDVRVPATVMRYGAFDADVNLIAPGVLILLTLLVVTGTKLSARVLTVAVLGKVAVIGLVIVVGARYVDSANYRPFVPAEKESDGTGSGTLLQAIVGNPDTTYGVFGVFAAASVITFAYIGFDLIATAAEDTRDPRHSIPRAMLISLGMVTLLYVAMAAVLVGLRPYSELGTGAPAAGVPWAAVVVSFGGLLAFTTVIMVVLIAQSRVLFAMGRDGLLPKSLSRVSGFSAPSNAAATAGIGATLLALYPGIASLEELLVIGTMAAFFSCAVGVLVLRRTQPDLERGFRVPAAPLLPLLSAAATAWLAFNLSVDTWRNFAIWTGIGLFFYCSYGYWQSRLARFEDRPEQAEPSHVPLPREPVEVPPPPPRPGRHAAGRRG